MKKILFIYNSYHEYGDKIIDALKRCSFEVLSFSLTPTLNSFEKIVNTLVHDKYFKSKSINEQKLFCNSLSDSEFDYVFVLTGRRLQYQTLSLLKNNYKKAKFILYLWDDILRVEHMKEYIKFFDEIYSFDLLDCKKYGFKHLPLFYVYDFWCENLYGKIFDVEFLGVMHSNRYELLKKLVTFCNSNNVSLDANIICGNFSYLKTKFFSSFSSDEDRSHCRFLKTKTLSLRDCSEVIKKSRSIVDMQVASQSGLTMRCIEALAAQCKIITTNDFIKEYDFYSPENIMIIDRDKPVFNVDFIRAPYKPIAKEIIEKYSLENWIKQIFTDD